MVKNKNFVDWYKKNETFINFHELTGEALAEFVYDGRQAQIDTVVKDIETLLITRATCSDEDFREVVKRLEGKYMYESN